MIGLPIAPRRYARSAALSSVMLGAFSATLTVLVWALFHTI